MATEAHVRPDLGPVAEGGVEDPPGTVRPDPGERVVVIVAPPESHVDGSGIETQQDLQIAAIRNAASSARAAQRMPPWMIG